MTAVWWFLYGQACVLTFTITLLMGRTHVKAVSTEKRLVNHIIATGKAIRTITTTAAASTAVTAPIASAGNVSFLAGLSAIGGLSSWPTFGGSPTLAELTGDVQNGVATVNEIIANMASNGFT